MAMVTVHQWPELEKGLGELRRVARGPVVVITFDGDAMDRYWLADYVPELISVERRRMPAIETIRAGLGGRMEVRAIPIPADCVDGFCEAFYAWPECLLSPQVRAAQSAWGFVGEEIKARFVNALSRDLTGGAWDARYGAWRRLPSYEGSLRLIVGCP